MRSFLNNLFQKKARSASSVVGYRFFSQIGVSDIASSIAWRYYSVVSPIARACNLISNEFSTISPVVKNLKTGDVYRQYDPKVPQTLILKLLSNPSKGNTGNKFKKMVALSMIVTGRSYIRIGGLTIPVDMKYYNPSLVTPFQGQYIPESYVYQSSTFSERFTDREGVYYTADGTARLAVMESFNPFKDESQGQGFSPLSSVYYEIEQFIETSVHNIATLKKGARPSGVLMTERVLTTEQKESYREQIGRFYQGTENSGNVMVLDGGREFKELSLTNKDMDFVKMLEVAEKHINEVLNIPASFFDNSASSYNNKEQDRMNLYDFAVLPLANDIYSMLTQNIFAYYKDGDQWQLTYIEEDIPALRTRVYENILKKSQSGVFAINELRSDFGKESIEGGDVIYQPLNLIPVGRDVYTQDNNKKPVGKSVLDGYIKQLKERGWSDERIKMFIEKNRKFLV